jgi:hypothetical protein
MNIVRRIIFGPSDISAAPCLASGLFGAEVWCIWRYLGMLCNARDSRKEVEQSRVERRDRLMVLDRCLEDMAMILKTSYVCAMESDSLFRVGKWLRIRYPE